MLNLLGMHTVFDNTAPSEAMSATLFAFMTLGAVWLVWASAAIHRIARMWMWYVVRRLTPLWQLLRPTGSSYVLDRPHGVTRYDPLPFRWQRIKIEIREFEVRLARFVHPQVGEWARQEARRRQFSQRKTEALVAAAELKSAVHAWAAATATARESSPRGSAAPALDHAATASPSRLTANSVMDDASPDGSQVLVRLGASPTLAQQIEGERALLRVAKLIRGRTVERLADRARREPAQDPAVS